MEGSVDMYATPSELGVIGTLSSGVTKRRTAHVAPLPVLTCTGVLNKQKLFIPCREEKKNYLLFERGLYIVMLCVTIKGLIDQADNRVYAMTTLEIVYFCKRESLIRR